MRTHQNIFRLLCFVTSILIVFGSCRGTTMAQQTEPPTKLVTANQSVTELTSSSTSTKTGEKSDVEQMKAQLALQQIKIDELERRLDEQKKLMEQVLHLNANDSATAANVLRSPTPARTEESAKVSSQTSDANQSAEAATNSAATTTPYKQNQDEPAPLAFKIGRVYLSPGGFLDFTSTFRDRN